MFNLVLAHVNNFQDMCYRENKVDYILCLLRIRIFKDDINVMVNVTFPYKTLYKVRATTEESFEMFGWVDLETQRKAHKCILVFECLNELVPPYLSDYFIRNRTIHTYKARQSKDIHLPNPKLTRGKKHI